MKPVRHLVLGGARSGKTSHALGLAEKLSRERDAQVIYVATAEAQGDPEMADRIARHRAERPAGWRTLEAPRQLARSLQQLPASAVVIVDCLTLWLSNALLNDFVEDAPTAVLPTWSAEQEAFIEYLRGMQGAIVLVSNEVGSGIVPMAAVTRRFRDEQGRLNQLVAGVCDSVTLVVAGLPIHVKQGA